MAMDDDFDAEGQPYDEFVPAAFARSAEDAEKFRELLEDHDIPVVLSNETEEAAFAAKPGMTRGVAVMVPDALLDEASEVIAAREDTSDFEEIEEFDDQEDDDEDFGLSEPLDIEGDDLYGQEDDEDDLFDGDDIEDLDDEDGEDF
jgi:hypothetical protein